MKPGQPPGPSVVALSHKNDTYRPYVFSTSPWLKNSSNSKSAQSSLTLNFLTDVLISVACSKVLETNCLLYSSASGDEVSIKRSTFQPSFIANLSKWFWKSPLRSFIRDMSVFRMERRILFFRVLTSLTENIPVRKSNFSFSRSLTVYAAWKCS